MIVAAVIPAAACAGVGDVGAVDTVAVAVVVVIVPAASLPSPPKGALFCQQQLFIATFGHDSHV